MPAGSRRYVFADHAGLLARGYFSGFSMERLLHFLNLLGRSIEIVVLPRRGSKRSSVRVVAS
ncbi:MAG: hypothetical protein HZB26_25900 [Candidatus Hydrogenedentes bacterium]|nr:hypothetical protein [Candidatus Hydrogenedentota bacterium]